MILPKGIKINERGYPMNIEADSIKDNKVLTEVIKNYQQIFKLHE